MTSGAPVGVVCVERCIRPCCPTCLANRKKKETSHKIGVLVLTFFCYCSYHLSRKPPSVVKNALNKNCSNVVPPPDIHITNETRYTWCDWAPFNGDDSDALLGILDSAFLIGYAVAMFFSGFLAERMNLRYFLALGMLLSGILTYLFGVGYYMKIHSFSFYVIVQVFGGIVQSTGWPGVVTCVASWFGKGNRGLIFGIWNSHTSLGNILGALIAGAFVKSNWGLSFIVPGIIIAVMGFVCFLFLVTDPHQVGLLRPNSKEKTDEAAVNPDRTDSDAENEQLLQHAHFYKVETKKNGYSHFCPIIRPRYFSSKDDSSGIVHVGEPEKAISFLGAVKIPGVVEFALCLFFSKLVNYTFLYWLPRYIKLTSDYDAEASADLSTLFDVGGIGGAILAGFVSDRSRMSATTCAIMLVMAIPLLLLYSALSHISLAVNITLLIIVGVMVNGPYALITTSVSADLGTHPSIQGNAKALATVTAIIDGTGSIGAAVGPFLAGLIITSNLNSVFTMLCLADVLALVFLLRQVKQEIQKKLRERRARNRPERP